ncbi:hypothetical protein CKM354_000430100 [Cercospora kikuchii]|uniref:Uncharacterized protein n=1 Tax=Cercospora kikuchii TaxID=84275 RepID=A0A9P3FEH6_9PEZI|nr:uncharacterized protein CKM354_000430100 [Cercospora kikuchii]GIZ40982.1 hypothetical protein CKM354_000430100 [Cercospora kikuchii]
MAPTKPMLSWHSDVSQFIEASSEEIMNYCAQPSVSAVASCQNIRRLSETLVVKFGFEVTKSEYKNQLFVYDMLANKKIKIARLYRFFRAVDSYGFSNGYLVTEYVREQRLQELNEPKPRRHSSLQV